MQELNKVRNLDNDESLHRDFIFDADTLAEDIMSNQSDNDMESIASLLDYEGEDDDLNHKMRAA